MVNQQDCDVTLVCKLFQNPDVLIVICVQIAVTASASNALQGINHNEFCVRMLCQELLDLLLQTALECVRHDCKMQRRRRIFRQVKESRLDALERIFETEIQRFALGCCEIPEWLLSLIHISEPTRQAEISYAVFCLKKKKQKKNIKANA